MEIDPGKLLEAGGAAALALVVWWELRTGLARITAALEKIADTMREDARAFREEASRNRDLIASTSHSLHEKISHLHDVDRPPGRKNSNSQ